MPELKIDINGDSRGFEAALARANSAARKTNLSPSGTGAAGVVALDSALKKLHNNGGIADGIAKVGGLALAFKVLGGLSSFSGDGLKRFFGIFKAGESTTKATAKTVSGLSLDLSKINQASRGLFIPTPTKRTVFKSPAGGLLNPDLVPGFESRQQATPIGLLPGSARAEVNAANAAAAASRFAMSATIAVGAAAAAGLAIAKFTAWGTRAGGELQDLSDKTGWSSDRLQAWANLADQAGSSAGGVSDAFVKLGKSMAAAVEDPSGKEALAFAKDFGVTISELEGSTIADVFEKVMKHLASSAIDAKTIASTLAVFGKGGAGMISVAKQAGAGGAGKSFNTPDEIARADKLGDTFTDAKNEIKGWAISGASLFQEAVDGIVGILTGKKEGASVKTKEELDAIAKQEVDTSATARDRLAHAGMTKDEVRNEELVKQASEIEALRSRVKPGSSDDINYQAKLLEIEQEQAAISLRSTDTTDYLEYIEKALAAEDDLETKRRANRLAAMTDVERLNALQVEGSKLKAEYDWQAMQDDNSIEHAEELLDLQKKIEDVNGEIISAKPKDDKDVASIHASSLTQIGGFAGGINPGLGIASYARQQVTLLEQIAQNTQPRAGIDAGGWQ